ncbi:MAG TPA: response regulator [Flavitalea sp.]|nr:response regulator [Flavitalea sp.]
MEKHFFLIDDDPDELDIFTEALHEVDPSSVCTWADSPFNALTVLKTTVPDIIFLDINMPRMDGFECLREIKKIENLSHVPVILYSNGLNDSSCKKAISLGAAGCVRKAADIPKLSSIIGRVMAKQDNHVFLEI